MPLKPVIVIVLLALSGLVSSCLNDDTYSTSPTDALTFSTDTVAFDTILSGEATHTYTFRVYNRNADAVMLQSVQLERGTASDFYVNVDGTPLSEGTGGDFELASGDSLTVFVMANLPERDTDEPFLSEDNLVFTTLGGAMQKVALRATGQDVITYNGKRVARDTLMAPSRPLRIMDSLVVEAGATLTIAPGTRCYFHAGAQLIVHGTLVLAGTADQPVQLRGDRMGNMFDGQAYDRIPAQWGGVILASESYDNYFSYADIHSGTFGVRVDSSDVTRQKLVIENSLIHNTSQHGLDIRMANAYIGNSQITNAGADCVHIRGGDVTMVHCTIARFYVFTGGSGVAFDFANYDGEARLPLVRLQVANTIITGYADDEIMGDQSATHTDDAYNYAFYNCLINTPPTEKEDKRLVNCILDRADGDDFPVKDGNFVPAFDVDALSFSFGLNPKSRAVGAADREITISTYPTDRLGRSRTDGDTAPDMGCYQHVPETSNP